MWTKDVNISMQLPEKAPFIWKLTELGRVAYKKRGNQGWIGYKKNELRHSRGAPHTNHIINNTKTNNQSC